MSSSRMRRICEEDDGKRDGGLNEVHMYMQQEEDALMDMLIYEHDGESHKGFHNVGTSVSYEKPVKHPQWWYMH